MGKSEELQRLERDLKEQPELREKLEAEIKRIAETKEAESDGEAMVKAAAALGYTITPEELDRSAVDLEKLDDDELDAAGGGDSGGCDWFFFSGNKDIRKNKPRLRTIPFRSNPSKRNGN